MTFVAPAASVQPLNDQAVKGTSWPQLHRRGVLGAGAGLALVGSGTWLWLRSLGYEVDPPRTPIQRSPPPPLVELSGPPFDPRAAQTLEILFWDLLPGDPDLGLPSAREAGVWNYVQAAARVSGLRPIRDDLLKLARFLDLGAKPESFSDLDAARRTQLVIETQFDDKRRGRFIPSRALEVALRFALEGYLGHPHHGGNRAFAAWDGLDIDMPRDRVAHHEHGEAP